MGCTLTLPAEERAALKRSNTINKEIERSASLAQDTMSLLLLGTSFVEFSASLFLILKQFYILFVLFWAFGSD